MLEFVFIGEEVVVIGILIFRLKNVMGFMFINFIRFLFVGFVIVEM